MDAHDLTRLLLGRLDVEAACEQSRLQASTRMAVDLAADLFPKLPWWRPALDISQ
jgi:hypothetical protein